MLQYAAKTSFFKMKILTTKVKVTENNFCKLASRIKKNKKLERQQILEIANRLSFQINK